MATITPLTESTRGIRVPDVTIRAPDHGKAAAFQGLSNVGRGMVDLASVLGRQQTEAELAEASISFQRDLTNIRNEAIFMDVDEAVKFVDDSIDKSIDSHANRMKSEAARTQFSNKARLIREGFYGEFSGQLVEVQRAKMRVTTVKALREAWMSGKFRLAETIADRAKATRLLTPEQVASERMAFDDLQEKLKIIHSADDVRKLESLREQLKEPANIAANERLIKKLKIEDKLRTENEDKKMAYFQARRITAEFYMARNWDPDALKDRLFNQLSQVPSFTVEEIHEIVRNEVDLISQESALNLASKGVPIEQITDRFPNLPVPTIRRAEAASREAIDKKLIDAQGWTAEMLKGRILRGELAPKPVDLNAIKQGLPARSEFPDMTAEETQKNNAIRQAAFTGDLRMDGIRKLADDGMITQRDAINLELFMKSIHAEESARRGLVSLAREIDNGIEAGTGAAFNLEHALHRDALDAWYTHEILTDRKTGEIATSLWTTSDLDAKLLLLDESVARRGVMPPMFWKDLEGTLKQNPNLAVVQKAARQIFDRVDRDRPGTYIESLDQQINPATMRLIRDLATNEQEKIPEIRARVHARAATNDLWVSNDGESETAKFFHDVINKNGIYPDEAFNDFKDLVRDDIDFQPYFDLSAAWSSAEKKLKTRWKTNMFGHVVRMEPSHYAKGMTEQQVYDQIAMKVVENRLGLTKLTNPEIDEMMTKYYRHPSRVPFGPDVRNNNSYLKNATTGGQFREDEDRSLGKNYRPADWSTMTREQKMFALAMAGLQAERDGRVLPDAAAFKADHKDVAEAADAYLAARTVNVSKEGFLRNEHLVKQARAKLFNRIDGKPRILVDVPAGVSEGDGMYWRVRFWNGDYQRYFEIEEVFERKVGGDTISDYGPYKYRPGRDPRRDQSGDMTPRDIEHERRNNMMHGYDSWIDVPNE